jgi:hypothetical protein
MRPRLSVRYGDAELLGETAVDFFHSIQGQDRFQSKVTNDFELDDRRIRHSAWLRYRLPGTGPAGSGAGQVPWIGIEHVSRSGRIGILRAGITETRYQAGVSVVF